MDNRIASSTEHTRLFLPLTCFCKPDQQTTIPEHMQGHSTTNVENLDDTLMDRETQEKILEDIRCRRLSGQNQQNRNQQQIEGQVQTKNEVHSRESLNSNHHQVPCQAQHQSHIQRSSKDVSNQGNASADGTGN